MRRIHLLFVPLVLPWAALPALTGDAAAQQPERVAVRASVPARVASHAVPLPDEPDRARVGTITGTITEEGVQRPLQGVQVTIPATGAGTLTNAQGRYVLVNVPAGQHSVRVQSIGYAPMTRTVTVVDGESAELDFQLAQRALELDAVVVTGTVGAQTVRSIGNTVGRVEAAELQAIAPRPTLETMLGGNVPGVSVAAGTGTIGAGANIRIRGAGSMVLSSQPLLYVDGVRVYNAPPGGDVNVGTGSAHGVSRLNDISPESIESIEVIKGPAAATLYGTEASNGVINIITKQGAAGSPVFSVTTRVGQNWYPDPKEHWQSAYFTCSGTGTHGCTPGEIVEVNVFREDYETLGLEHFRVGMPYGFAGSVAGGAQSLRYYFSLDYDRDEGPVFTSHENSLNARANLNWLPREDLRVQFGLGVVRSDLRSPTANQPAETVGFNWACPSAGCERGTGTPNALDGPFRGYIAYLPEMYRNYIYGGQDVNRSTYSLSATHDPFSWLSHRVILGMDVTETQGHRTIKHLQGQVGVSNREGLRQFQFRDTEYLSADYSATATLRPREGLAFATSGGIQYYSKTSDGITGQGQRFAVPTLESITAGITQTVSDEYLQNKTLGMYVQEQLSWQDRLFLTAAVRGDDNSAFGQDFDFVMYPKLSASWVVSEERFMEPAGAWLNSLRLRAAWGQAGQQPDAFAAVRLYEPVPGFNGAGGLTPETFGNPGVEPEIGEELEVGADFSILEERLGVEFTYYDKKRKNALIAVPVKPSTGFPGTQFENIGEVAGKGVELGLRFDAYRGENVNLHLGATLATNSSEITDMGGLGPQPMFGVNASTGWEGQRFVEGFPLGAIFQPRVVSAEVIGSGKTARAVNVMCESGPIAVPGTRLTRGGGPPVPCSAADAPEVYRGTPLPTREIGVNSTLTLFQDVSLFAHVDYVGGHTMIDGITAAAHTFFRNTQAIHEGTDPILLGYIALGASGSNQPGLMDASFARLRQVSLSYDIPARFSGAIGADGATFTLSGQNLAMLWRAETHKFKRMLSDPEVRTTGSTATDPGGLSAYTQDGYPLFKRVMATLRVSF